MSKKFKLCADRCWCHRRDFFERRICAQHTDERPESVFGPHSEKPEIRLRAIGISELHTQIFFSSSQASNTAKGATKISIHILTRRKDEKTEL